MLILNETFCVCCIYVFEIKTNFVGNKSPHICIRFIAKFMNIYIIDDFAQPSTLYV